MARYLMVLLKSSSFRMSSTSQNRMRTAFTPNQDFKVTTFEPDYLNFAVVQRNKHASGKYFVLATIATAVNAHRMCD